MRPIKLLKNAQKLFSVGVISDVQYADIPDGRSYRGKARFYRNALKALTRAVVEWILEDHNLYVQCGDILDGLQPKEGAEEALSAVLQQFERTGKPVLHMIGNHCLYNMSRSKLNRRLGIDEFVKAEGRQPGPSYYCYSPHPLWRIIVLDSYDVSLLGSSPGQLQHELAVKILGEKNPNENKNASEGQTGLNRRFVGFGGGLSDEQLRWLANCLDAAEREGQRVLVTGHIPIHPETAPCASLLWNYEEVLSLLASKPAVAATITGHTHENAYVQDENGIHHLVLPAVVETPPGRDAFGSLLFTPDSIEVCGRDTYMSLTLPLVPRITVAQ